jgi:serine/threonine protein kinase
LFFSRECLRELQAHALLSKHPNIVRYYSSWCEEGHVYVQTEYCAGGSLRDVLNECSGKSSSSGHHSTNGNATEETRKAIDTSGGVKKRRRPNSNPGSNKRNVAETARRGLGEDVLAAVARDVARGLAYMHAVNLAHLDVKPDNIFVSHDPLLDTMWATVSPSASSSLANHSNPNLSHLLRPASARSFTASPMPPAVVGQPQHNGAFSFHSPPSFTSTPAPRKSVPAVQPEPTVVYRIGEFCDV